MKEKPVERKHAPFRLGAKQPALKFPLSASETVDRVNNALAEDGAHQDVTSIATVQSDRRTQARLVARQPGVVCGVDLATKTFQAMDSKCTIRIEVPDGTRVARGETIIAVSGHARCILAAERVALNFMQRLSGVATLTRQYVDAVGELPTKVLDTRKTTPGWRSLEKYAVRCGGGHNHRMDLASAVLIKDNHLVAVGGDVARAFARDARRYVVTRGVLRTLLGAYLDRAPSAVQLAYGEWDKPYLAQPGDLHFNVAHSHELALLGFQRGTPLGVDLEQLRPLDDMAEVVTVVFSEREQAAWHAHPEQDRVAAFYAGWTRKEAVIKAVGEGLSYPLRTFSVALQAEEAAPACTLAAWRLTSLVPQAGYLAAAATVNRPVAIHFHDWRPGSPANAAGV